MVIIEAIQYSLAVLMITLLGYQLVRGIWALKKRRKVFSHTLQDRQFAIVITSAKNKQMISNSLYSLFGLVYPKSKYDVIISADCFTEEAAQTAKKMGAIVLNGHTSLKKKSQSKTSLGF